MRLEAAADARRADGYLRTFSAGDEASSVLRARFMQSWDSPGLSRGSIRVTCSMACWPPASRSWGVHRVLRYTKEHVHAYVDVSAFGPACIPACPVLPYPPPLTSHGVGVNTISHTCNTT